MVNEKWDYVMSSIETEWPILLGSSYDTLNLLTHGKGVGDVASDFLLDIYHPQDILRDREKRNIIISVMPESYIVELADDLAVHYHSVTEAYYLIKNIKYSRNVERIILDYFGIEPVQKMKKNVIEGEELIDLSMLSYPLRDYQRQIISDIGCYFSDGCRRCMVQMPTGSGKTRTLMYYISQLMNESENCLVLWLAYSKELCDQASDEFSKVWHIRGNKSATIFRYYGDSNCILPNSQMTGIIITTLSKINNAKNKNDTLVSMLSNKVQLVVFDEAHQIIAPTYQSIVDEVIMLNSESRLIGLTATPGRTWNNPDEDRKLSDYFYHNIVTIKTNDGKTPNEMLTERGYLSKIEWRYCECSNPVLSPDEVKLIMKMRDDDEIPSLILDKVSLDAKRNTKIISEVERLLEEGKKRILLFSTNLEHARLMCGLLKIFTGKYGCTVDYISGNTDAAVREKIIRDFKRIDSVPRIICNYNVLTTGFDAPNVDAGIIARPTKSLVLFSQMVGRMIRGPQTIGGTEKATIVSVVDLGLPGFKDAHDNWRDVWQ